VTSRFPVDPTVHVLHILHKNRRARNISEITNTTKITNVLLLNLTVSHGRPISEIQHDRQCTYKVSLSRVRATIVAAEKQQVLRILSVCL
jgi:hypothetical protein